MYLVYSLHPKSFKVTARSVHRDHTQAIDALVKQAHDYITRYRGHKELTSVKNLSEIEKPETQAGFYYVIADEIDDRLTIYEKKALTDPGYLYNGTKLEINPYLIFSLTQLPAFDGFETEIATVTAPRNVNKLEQIKPNVVQTHHAHYMTELHALLKKRGPVESELAPVVVPVSEPAQTVVDQELLELLNQIEKQE